MEAVYTYKGAVDLDDLHDLRQQTEDALKERGLAQEACESLVLVVDEWITNIINHAYQGKKGELELKVDVRHDQARICISDHGPVFDITSYKDVTIKNINTEESKPGGLGIELIRRMVDSLEYTRSEDGWNANCFTRLI